MTEKLSIEEQREGYVNWAKHRVDVSRSDLEDDINLTIARVETLLHCLKALQNSDKAKDYIASRMSEEIDDVRGLCTRDIEKALNRYKESRTILSVLNEYDKIGKTEEIDFYI